MQKTILYIMGCLVLSLSCFNCGGGNNSGGTDPVNPPEAASLIFPSNNSQCTEGTNISSIETTVTFDWYNASFATSYEIVVKNLLTQTTQSYNASSSQMSVTLLKSTPYSWYVISKNETSETAQSDIWKFYNAGDAVSSYAPFPADLVAPSLYATFNASTTNVTLEWTGDDVDNDIKEYQVYFGTVKPPSNLVTTTNSTSFSADVSSGNTYYWKIITKDNQNNSSESQIFQFSVD